MRGAVDAAQLARRLGRGGAQRIGRNEAIEKARGSRLLRPELGAGDQAAVEVGAAEPVAGDRDPEPRHGEPDRDLVEPDPEVPRDSHVAHPALSAVMFSRPFASFDPAPEESAAGSAVRELIVGAVRRAVAAGRLSGDPTDVAHACVALVQGLAAAEISQRLGTSPEAVERRWESAVGALLRGFGSRQG